MRQDPPEWSREKMLTTAFQIFCVILVLGVGLMIIADTDLLMVKEQQKIKRLNQYMTLARMTILEKEKQGVRYPEQTDLLTPEQISRDYAELNGSYGYYEDEGRYLRLDIFYPDGPFKGPTRYYVEGSEWFLVSRGPDMDFDLSRELLTSISDESSTRSLENLMYNPENGVASDGDIIISGKFGE